MFTRGMDQPAGDQHEGSVGPARLHPATQKLVEDLP
jgi:hypothetical protein